MCYKLHILLDLYPSVIFQLQLLTTWGDPYYIGLNGLEFYDQNHEKINLSDNSILFTNEDAVNWQYNSSVLPQLFLSCAALGQKKMVLLQCGTQEEAWQILS